MSKLDKMQIYNLNTTFFLKKNFLAHIRHPLAGTHLFGALLDCFLLFSFIFDLFGVSFIWNLGG